MTDPFATVLDHHPSRIQQLNLDYTLYDIAAQLHDKALGHTPLCTRGECDIVDELCAWEALYEHTIGHWPPTDADLDTRQGARA